MLNRVLVSSFIAVAPMVVATTILGLQEPANAAQKDFTVKNTFKNKNIKDLVFGFKNTTKFQITTTDPLNSFPTQFGAGNMFTVDGGNVAPGNSVKFTVHVEGNKPSIFIKEYSFTDGTIQKVPLKKRHNLLRPGGGNLENKSSVDFNSNGTLSFGNIAIDSLFLNGGIPSVTDPLLGATALISNTVVEGSNPTLLGDNSNEGFFFEDTTYSILVDGTPVLTADVINSFLFVGGGVKPEFDSEFQGVLDNIVINNTIDSPYLDDLENYTQAGGLSHLAFFSNILSDTNNLTTSGSSEGIAWADATEVPEPTSTLAFLGLGTLGAASTLKRKLKQSKDKKLEKIS